MDFALTIAIAAISLAAAALAVALTCLLQMKNYRQTIVDDARQIAQLEMLAIKHNEELEASSQKLADQARRLAWLETRARPIKSIDDETTAETANAISKPNITERRHRVLTLYSRGQDAETIASTLGMLHGEVELIINLNQAI